MVYPMATTLDKKTPDRIAYSFDETAALFGREKSWVYRQVKAKKISVIRGYGKMMVPISEIDRIVATAEEVAP